MSTCVYKLGGRVFGSELDLDNFLYNYLDSFDADAIPDLVFSTRSPKANVLSKKLDDKAEELKANVVKAAKLRARRDEFVSEAESALIANYYGANMVLSTVEIAPNTRITPEFIRSKLKANLFNQWTGQPSAHSTGISKNIADILAAAGYTENGRQLKAGDIITEQTYAGNSTNIEDIFPKCNDIFENYVWPYWAGLGKVGTAMHRVAEMFWLGESTISILNDSVVITGDDSFTGDLSRVSPVLSNDAIHEFLTYLNSLKATLQARHGKNCKFRPEYPVVAKSSLPVKGNHKANIIGIIDLVVEDEQGIPHIYDYKTSDKDMDEWGAIKKRSYMAQLGLYRRILESYGINVEGSTLGILPINLSQYNITRDGSPRVNGIECPTDVRGLPYIEDVSRESALSPLGELTAKINKLVYAENELEALPTNFIRDIEIHFKEFFPSYTFQKDYDDAVKAGIEAEIKENLNNGKYMFPKIPGEKERMEYDKDEISQHMEEFYKKYVTQNDIAQKRNIFYIKQAIREQDPARLPAVSSVNYGDKGEWFIPMFSRYCNGSWEPINNDALESLNILALRNKISGQVNFFVLSGHDLSRKIKMKEGTTVLGQHVNDITPQHAGVIPLEADLGNIELMKAMVAINLAARSVLRKGDKLGEVMAINIWNQQGRTTSNKQLMDNFNALCDYSQTTMPNNFANGKIEVASATQKVATTMLELGSLEKVGVLNRIYSKYEKNLVALDIEYNTLNRLRKELEDAYPDLAKGEVDINTPQGAMYSTIMTAISEMNNAYYTQELRDSSFVQLNVNTPEMMESSNLRRLRALTNNAFQRLRDRMNSEAAEWRIHYDKLIKAKGYSRGEKWITDNDSRLYENMIIHNKEQGILKFKNPWDRTNDLTDEEREFLKWYLDKQDQLRFEEDSTEESRQLRRADSNSQYFDVPLMESKGQEKILNGRTKGLVSWFKRTVQWWRHPIQNAKRLEAKVLTNEKADEAKKTAQAFRIMDVFEESENEVTRTKLLKEHDLDYFTTSVEKIFYAYSFSKIRKSVLDSYMPVLKGMYVMLKTNGMLNNIGIEQMEKYLLNYVEAKIMNRSLVSDEYKGLAHAMGKLRNVTSEITLGVSPKAFLFQLIEGVWKNNSRSIVKPMGLNQFGHQEYKEALIWLLGDAKNHFKVVSMGELINEQYGINDQDINVLQDRLREGQDALTFQGKLMWMVSAPDYMNRMAIFVAQMKADGCFDAHIMNDDGFTMTYDCSKDSRFNKLKFNRKSREDIDSRDPEYLKQLATYKRMVDEFNAEGYKIVDPNTGLERRMTYNDKLPRAYTNREARSIKSFADSLYGYYNHEDQYLLKSYLLGALFTQFRTYWSSLKNRWWLRGGIYSQGHWEHMKNSKGELMYKKIINEGQENERVILIPESQLNGEILEPYMDWKGSYQEGYCQTVLSLFKDMFSPNEDDLSMSERARQWWKGQEGIDDTVAYTRRANIKLMIHDLSVFCLIQLIFGTIIMQLFKEQKKSDKTKNLTAMEKALRSAERVGLYAMIQSGSDLGIGDVFSPMTDWTPPSFAVAKEAWKDMGEVMTGDQNFFKAVVDNVGFLRQTKTLWSL